MRPIFRISIFAVLALLSMMFPGSAYSDYAPLHPEYPKLTSRALGMGGATAAWIDDGTSIFHNPAGLGRVRSLTITHSHSRNHFPGEIENLDQLDCDPTSFIVPLSGAFLGYPIGSAGTGWMLQGELGYDYRTRNFEAYPRERLFGMGQGDRTEGAGIQVWPGGYLGFAHRMSEYNFTSGAEIPDGVTWRRTGEGWSAGVQQTVFPGINYGAVFEQMDYDYLPYRENITAERTKTFRSGWCIRPTAWLTIARDIENVELKEWQTSSMQIQNRDSNGANTITPTVSERAREYWGIEVKLGSWFAVRWGSFDGHATSGWSYRVGPWRSDSAWVDGMMYEMVSNFPDPSQAGEYALPDGRHDVTDYHATGSNLGD